MTTIRILAVALIISFGVDACASWAPINLSAADALAAAKKKNVRLTLRDSSIVELQAARIDGDSIRGNSPSLPDGRSNARAVATADVRTIAVQKTDYAKSAKTVGKVVGVASLGAAIVYCLSHHFKTADGQSHSTCAE
jgi:hypothetical protein